MEGMVIDTVKGTPTTAPSRTAQFRSRDRSQTPAPRGHRDSSFPELDSDVPTEVGTEGSGDVDSSSFYGKKKERQKKERLQSLAVKTPLFCNLKKKRQLQRAEDPQCPRDRRRPDGHLKEGYLWAKNSLQNLAVPGRS